MIYNYIFLFTFVNNALRNSDKTPNYGCIVATL